MNEFPLVSIIIPVFNRKKLIQESIQSVQDQTYPNWELIIVDDGSMDGTWEFVSCLNIKDQRIRAIRPTNFSKGAAFCRNRGIEEAKGEYLIFLDSDDLLKSTCLEKRVQAFQQNQLCDFIVFQYDIFSEEIGYRKKELIQHLSEDDIENFLDEKSPWLIPCCIWKKEKIKQIDGFDENLLNWMGWEIHMKALIQNLKYKKYTEVDSCVREHKGDRVTKSTSIKIETHQEKLIRREEMFKKMYHLFVQNNQLTQTRNKKWARLFLVTSLEWIRIKNKQAAINCWMFVKQAHMISFFSYYFILFILKVRYSLQKIGMFKWITKIGYRISKKFIFN